MRSLTLRVALLATAVLMASLALATFVAFELLLIAGRDDLDGALRREQSRFERTVDEVLAQRDDGDERRALAEAVDRYLRVNPGSDTYYSIIRLDGGPPRTSAVGPDPLLRLAERGQLPSGTPGQLETVSTVEGEVRVLTTPVRLREGPIGATFAVAGSLEEIRDESISALSRLGLAAGASLALGAPLSAFVLRAALAPLRQVAAAARATQDQDLSARVPQPARNDEVALLAREFNRMLDRLEEAAESRRRFLATVSHELRTPLTIARGHLELLDTPGPGGPGGPSPASRVVAAELRRMGRLVDDLMALARSSGEGFLVAAELPLDRFFADLRFRLTGLDIDGVTVHDPPAGACAWADGDRLAQAVLNLVTNAHHHGPPGTCVDVSAAVPGGGEVVITVADDGPGIDPSVRDRVLEPFVSGPGPRPGTGGRSGLGLAVVAAVAEAHRGTVAIATGPDGTRVALHLPATDPGTAPA